MSDTAAIAEMAASSAAICQAVLTLRGEALHAELARIAGGLLAAPDAAFIACTKPADAQDGLLSAQVWQNGDSLGRYELKGRPFVPEDQRQLDALAALTGTLLQREGLLGQRLRLCETPSLDSEALAAAGIDSLSWWQGQLHAYHWAIQVARNV